MTVKQVHQNNRRVRRVKQEIQFVKLFVERGKFLEIVIGVENTTAEKSCVTKQFAQKIFNFVVAEIIREIIFECLVKIPLAQPLLVRLHYGIRFALRYQILHDEIFHVVGRAQKLFDFQPIIFVKLLLQIVA